MAAAFFLATKKLKVRGCICLVCVKELSPLLSSHHPKRTMNTQPSSSQIKVDRKRLQELAGVQTGELNNVVASMQVGVSVCAWMYKLDTPSLPPSLFNH